MGGEMISKFLSTAAALFLIAETASAQMVMSNEPPPGQLAAGQVVYVSCGPGKARKVTGGSDRNSQGTLTGGGSSRARSLHGDETMILTLEDCWGVFMKVLFSTILSAVLAIALSAPVAAAGNKHNCPAGTAWSNYNQQCSRHNWCWQKLGLPSSSQNPTGPALAKLEACKAKGWRRLDFLPAKQDARNQFFFGFGLAQRGWFLRHHFSLVAWGYPEATLHGTQADTLGNIEHCRQSWAWAIDEKAKIVRTTKILISDTPRIKKQHPNALTPSIELGHHMKHIILAGLFGIFSAASFSTASLAQDLSMCTATYPVSCCKNSYAKFGPFGGANGEAKERRRAELDACAAKQKTKK
jgi:hypothetical protein